MKSSTVVGIRTKKVANKIVASSYWSISSVLGTLCTRIINIEYC